MMHIQKYSDSRREACDYIQESDQIHFKNNKAFKINANMNCKTIILIYCVTCSQCRKYYIGKTGTRLHDRFRVQNQQIKNL